MIQIIDTQKYRESIIALWHECFGDDREYIEFFLDNCPEKCLGIVADGSLVSMLFLLDGFIEEFRTAYIYAACTAEKYRRRGYISRLIEYSEIYCAENKYDAVFLVPAEESLYSFYEKFGFIPAFEKYIYVEKDIGGDLSALTEINDAEKILSVRKRLMNCVPAFRFEDKTTIYAIKEHFFNGGKVYYYSCDNAESLVFALSDKKNYVIKELLTDKSVEMLKNIKHFINISKENIYIHYPIVYNNTGKMAKTAKCGMYCPLTDEMKNSSVGKIFYAGLFLD